MSRQQGAALIMVLGIMAIISLLASQLIEQVRHSTRQSQAIELRRQALWYALASEQYALAQIKKQVDQMMLSQTERQGALAFPQGSIHYQLDSLHNCLNLNSLVIPAGTKRKTDTQWQAQQAFLLALWQQLLNDTLELPDAQGQRWVERLQDWLDNDASPAGIYGAEAPFYSSLSPARLPADGPLISASELTELALLDDPHWAKLAPLICARPGDTQLALHPNDLSLAQAPLLRALSLGQLSNAQASELISQRPHDGYTSLDAFWQHPVWQGITLTPQLKAAFQTERHYYRLQTEVRLAPVSFRLISWLYMDKHKSPRVLRRRYGVVR